MSAPLPPSSSSSSSSADDDADEERALSHVTGQVSGRESTAELLRLAQRMQQQQTLAKLQQQQQTQNAYYARISNPLRGGQPAAGRLSDDDEISITDKMLAAANLRFLILTYPDLFTLRVGDAALACQMPSCKRTTHVAVTIPYSVLVSEEAMRAIYPKDAYLFARYYLENLYPRALTTNAARTAEHVGGENDTTPGWHIQVVPPPGGAHALSQIEQRGLQHDPLYHHREQRPAPSQAPSQAPSPSSSPEPQRHVVYTLCPSHLPLMVGRSPQAVQDGMDVHVALLCRYPCYPTTLYGQTP